MRKQKGEEAAQRRRGVEWKHEGSVPGQWCFVPFRSMKCISWNVRGIGGCGKDAAIRKLIGDFNPMFIGLVETKHSRVDDTKIKKWWAMGDCKWFHVAAEEGSGGLVCIWSNVLFEESCIRSGRRWVCVEGLLKDQSFRCAILVVYAPNLRNERRLLWEELLELRDAVTVPILAMGDFNEVFSTSERKGGSGCVGSMEEFKNWVANMCLSDLHLHGRKFTWSRGNWSSRIDRMLVDADWVMKFPGLKLKALPSKLSDHTPLLLEVESIENNQKLFRCLDAWFTHPGFKKAVQQEWRSLVAGSIVEKLHKLKKPLQKWNKDVFGNIDTNISRFEKELDVVERRVDVNGNNEVDNARILALKSQLQIWYKRKELYWRQLSRDTHTKLGDRNTRYFHAVAVGRRRKKRIAQLRVRNRLMKNPRVIKKEIVRFYKKLYSQKILPHVFLPDGFLLKISQEQASILERMPSKEEISLAVKSCDPSKAPGYDGFNLNFIKKFWDDFGEEICSFIFGFFESGHFPPEINLTWVALIPKIDEAVEIKDYRPISMVGCLYKLISKILANRVKLVMPGLVGETQSAFVSGRQILDGGLIANEVVWWLKKAKMSGFMLKLDFQKAYDTVRWSFLDHVLDCMGFGSKWRSWVGHCVTSASMSILVNGSPSAPFKMNRGLRQGDPLSPFLFVLVGEVFNKMVEKAKSLNLVEGLKVGRDAVDISHLQFANDTLVLCPKKKEYLINYRRMLNYFSIMSGLQINYSKSALIHFRCEESWVDDIKNELRCSAVHLPITYLGIPLGANPKRVSTWKPVVDKIERRLALWKAKLLSRAGRLVLIKSVLNNLPLYYLSIFKMPKTVALKIIKLQRSFFWCSDSRKKGIPLVDWKTI